MNRITKWIQERKSFSNPVFGMMLIINVMVFPVFQASARIVEPVQGMVQSAEDAVDAVNSVNAGTTIEQAFLEQPLPYRVWIKSQKFIYETLFEDTYDFQNAVYVLDEEVTVAGGFSTATGSLDIGHEFSVHFSLLSEYNYVDDEDLSNTEVNSLAEVDASIFGFIGTMTTDVGSVSVDGVVLQATRPDGGRNRSIVVFGIVDSELITGLNEYNLNGIGASTPVGGFVDCELAFAQADLAFGLADELARIELTNCRDNNMADWARTMVACVGAGGLAAAMASPSGPGAFVVGMLTGLACGIGASAAAMANNSVCSNNYNSARAAANAIRNAARANARLVFGVENCPGDPV